MSTDKKDETTKKAGTSKDDSKQTGYDSEGDDMYKNIRAISATPEGRTLVKDIPITAIAEPTYPSQWFRDNPKKKPSICLDKSYNDHLDDWTHTVIDKWKDGTLTAEEAVTFVYSAFSKKPMDLQKKWESFGRLIGDAQAKCYLTDLADVELHDKPLARLSSQGTFSEETILTYIIAICAVYRFSYTTLLDSYQKDLTAKLAKILGKEMNQLKFTLQSTVFAQWISSTNYVKMCAFVDMYLAEFPRHPYAKARFGTICTRYKDCTALLTIPFILGALGIKLSRLAVWIWVPEAREQFLRLTKEGEEINDTRSYALYFIELGLSNKSPYSSTLNNTVHMLFHLVGAGRASKRSIHAKVIGTPDYETCAANAAIILFAHGASTNMQATFMPDGTAIKDEDEPLYKPENKPYPQTRDPIKWTMFMHKLKFQVDEFFLLPALNVWAKLAETRPETIGRTARDMSKAKLLSFLAKGPNLPELNPKRVKTVEILTPDSDSESEAEGSE